MQLSSSLNVATIVALFIASGNAFADAKSDAQVAVAKKHVEAFLRRDFDALAKTYGSKVLLMPGHEFLKPSYGLAEDAERKTATKVELKALLAKMKEKVKDATVIPDEAVVKIMKELEFTITDLSEKDGEIAPSDPVSTPNGKLNFPMQKGDVVIKVAPSRGDYILLHLSESDGKWNVVSEYLD